MILSLSLQEKGLALNPIFTPRLSLKVFLIFFLFDFHGFQQGQYFPIVFIGWR
jgi:hypothetical protein